MAEPSREPNIVTRFFRRRFVRLTIVYALLYYLATLILDSFIFLLAHLPPRVLPMDRLIVGLTYGDQFLHLPRTLLRHLWLSERTPSAVNWLLSVVNCLVWGAVLGVWQMRRRKNDEVRALLS